MMSLFCINGTEHRVKRDSETLKDTLNDFIRRKTPYKVRSETLGIPRIRHHLSAAACNSRGFISRQTNLRCMLY